MSRPNDPKKIALAVGFCLAICISLGIGLQTLAG